MREKVASYFLVAGTHNEPQLLLLWRALWHLRRAQLMTIIALVINKLKLESLIVVPRSEWTAGTSLCWWSKEKKCQDTNQLNF